MTLKSTATWTCNRCKKQEEFNLNGSRKQPKDWIEVLFQPVALIRTNRTSVPTRAGHLCNECGGLLISFVEGTLEEDMAKIAWQQQVMREIDAQCLWSGVDLLPRGASRLELFNTRRFEPDLDEEDELEDEDEDDE